MWKKEAGLDNGNDPKKKVALAIVALACIVAVSLALDVVQGGVAPQTAQQEPTSQSGGSQDGGGSSANGEDAEEQDAERLGGYEVGHASYLDALDSELKSSLGDYLAAYLESEGLSPDDTRLFCSQEAVSDQAGATAYFHVVGKDLYIECDYEGSGAWNVTSWSASDLVSQQ